MLKGIGICLGIFGLLLFLAGLIVPPVFIYYAEKGIKNKEVIDSDTHSEYQDWTTNTDSKDAPLYYTFYFYNVTNPDEIKNGGMIKLQELGPYYYRIWQTKYNIRFLDNQNKVEFNTREWYEFVPSLSNGTESDLFLLPNPYYAAAIMKAGSEAKFNVGILGGVLNKQLLAAGINNQTAEVWGTFNGTRLGGSATTPYLTYGEYIQDNFPLPDKSIISFNKNQSTALLYDPNTGLLVVDPKTGLYWVAVFLNLVNSCNAAGFDMTSQPCATILQLWKTSITSNPQLFKTQVGLLGRYFSQYLALVVQPLLQKSLAAAGGGAFQLRTVKEWVVAPKADPFLALLGKPPASLLCGLDSGPTWPTDPCDRGKQVRWTGKSDVTKVQAYFADRSMEVAPALNQVFCSPFKACQTQPGAGVWGGPLTVEGNHPGYPLGPGYAQNAYGWTDRLNTGVTLRTWSETLYRPVTFVDGIDTSTNGLSTFRYYLSTSVGNVDPFYFTSIRLVLNRTSQTQGLPVFAVPNHLIAFTPAEVQPLLQVQVTLIDGCVTGQGKCYSNDLYTYGTWLEAEPKTGVTVELHERLTNVVLVPKMEDGDYGKIRPGIATLGNATLVPLLRVDKNSRATDSNISDLKTVSRVPWAATVILIVGLVVGFVLMVVGNLMTVLLP